MAVWFFLLCDQPGALRAIHVMNIAALARQSLVAMLVSSGWSRRLQSTLWVGAGWQGGHIAEQPQAMRSQFKRPAARLRSP